MSYLDIERSARTHGCAYKLTFKCSTCTWELLFVWLVLVMTNPQSVRTKTKRQGGLAVPYFSRWLCVWFSHYDHEQCAPLPPVTAKPSGDHQPQTLNWQGLKNPSRNPSKSNSFAYHSLLFYFCIHRYNSILFIQYFKWCRMNWSAIKFILPTNRGNLSLLEQPGNC